MINIRYHSKDQILKCKKCPYLISITLIGKLNKYSLKDGDIGKCSKGKTKCLTKINE